MAHGIFEADLAWWAAGYPRNHYFLYELFFLFEHKKMVRTKKNGPRQWAIWAGLGPRRASNSTAQGRWWPQGLPRNDQFSTGFIRFSASVDPHVSSSGNAKGFGWFQAHFRWNGFKWWKWYRFYKCFVNALSCKIQRREWWFYSLFYRFLKRWAMHHGILINLMLFEWFWVSFYGKCFKIIHKRYVL